MDQDALMVEFLRTEVETGITFANLALTARYEEKIERNRANARKAYDTSLRFMGAVSAMRQVAPLLKDRVEHLRAKLKQLGESV